MLNHAKPLEGCPPEEALKAYVDGELPAPARELVTEHVTACAACEAESAAFRRFGEELQKLDGALEPPTELRSRILSQIRFRPERSARRFTFFDLARWGAVGATAAIVVTISAGLVGPALQSAQKVASPPASPAGNEKPVSPGFFDLTRSPGGAPAAGGGIAGAAPPVVVDEPDMAGKSFADGHVKSKDLDRLGPGRKNGDPYQPRMYVQDYDETTDDQSRSRVSSTPGVTPEDVKKYTRGKEADEVRRKVVQSGDLSVRVSRKLETVQDEVAARVKRDGGYVETSNLTAPEKGDRTSAMTLRVPVEKFETTVAWLSGLGEVQAKNLSGQDITGTWIDQRAEVRELRHREEQLVKKIETARTPAEREQARWRLQALRPQIGTAEEQFAYTGKLAALASVRLTLTEEPQARVRGNLIHDLDGTTRAAMAAFMVAVRVPAAILIWLAIFSPLWLPCVLVYRWASRRRENEGIEHG